jgi:hypothetical protein
MNDQKGYSCIVSPIHPYMLLSAESKSQLTFAFYFTTTTGNPLNTFRVCSQKSASKHSLQVTDEACQDGVSKMLLNNMMMSE